MHSGSVRVMTRVPAEDIKHVAVTVEGREYRSNRGFFEVDNPRHAAAILAEGGFGKSWQTAGPVAPSLGYRCPECGFGSLFVRCGRCGEQCMRESDGRE